MLRMVKPDVRAGADDEATKLVGQLWNELGGESKQGIDSGLLLQYVAAILNIPLPKEVPAQPLSPDSGLRAPGSNISPNANSISSSYPNPNLNSNLSGESQTGLSAEVAQKLQKDYAAFWLTRKSLKPQRQTAKPVERDFDFKPSLCEKSVKLADNGRDRYGKRPSEDPEAKRKSVVGLADILTQHKRDQEEYCFIGVN